jgi:hypothetical protein
MPVPTKRRARLYALFTTARLEPTAFGKQFSPGSADVVRTALFSVRQQSQKSTRMAKVGHYPGLGVSSNGTVNSRDTGNSRHSTYSSYYRA